MHASRPGLAPTAGRSRPGAPAPRPGRRRLTCGRSPTRCASVLLCPRQQDGGGRAAPPRASLPAPLAIGWPRSARGRGGPSALLLGRRDSPRRLPEGAGSAAGRGGGAGGVLAASTGQPVVSFLSGPGVCRGAGFSAPTSQQPAANWEAVTLADGWTDRRLEERPWTVGKGVVIGTVEGWTEEWLSGPPRTGGDPGRNQVPSSATLQGSWEAR